MNEPDAELLMDSARSETLSGRRGGESPDRQLVYRHAGLQVDLLVQRAAPAAAFVWGQVSHAQSGDPCCGAGVSWSGGVSEEDRVATDEFGEFSLAAPPSGLGVLAIDADTARFLCRITRPGSAARPPEARER